MRSAGRQYIDQEGRVLGGDNNPQLFCAWDVLFRLVRLRFKDTIAVWGSRPGLSAPPKLTSREPSIWHHSTARTHARAEPAALSLLH